MERARARWSGARVAILAAVGVVAAGPGGGALVGGGPGAWERLEDFPGTPRFAGVGFAAGGVGFVGTGHDGSFRDDLWAFGPEGWESRAPLPGGPRRGAVATSDGLVGYVGTGYFDPDNVPDGDEVFYRDFWAYDPAADTWTRKADFPGEGRRGAVAFTLGPLVYVGLGWTGIPPALTFHRDLWAYDPLTDRWSREATFGGLGRADAVAFALGPRAFVTTGWGPGPTGAMTFHRDTWAFDPVAGGDTDGDALPDGAWVPRAEFGGAARADAVAFVTDPLRAWVSTGMAEGGQFFGDTWEYDLVNDAWVPRANLPGPGRGEGVAFATRDVPALGGVGSVVTGSTSASPGREHWAFTPP